MRYLLLLTILNSSCGAALYHRSEVDTSHEVKGRVEIENQNTTKCLELYDEGKLTYRQLERCMEKASQTSINSTVAADVPENTTGSY